MIRPEAALLVVADDLTGACDSAGVIAAWAGPIPVALLPYRGRASVVAVDLDSRAGTAKRAIELTMTAMNEAAAVDVDVYLKIDSTLRGHVVATVQAAAAAHLRRHPGGRVIVCPAFPARRRTVRRNRVFVDGVPTPSGVLDALARLPGVEVHDATSDEELSLLARSGGDAALWVGSAGLAAHVARAYTPAVPTRPLPAVPSVAVVVGTEHPDTLEAGRALRGHPRVEVVEGDPRDRSTIDRAEAAAAQHAGMVLTGGYTARRVLNRLRVPVVSVGGELEAGIPWSTTVDGSRVFVTKAGAFGDRGTLGRAVDRLLATA